jgi:hypothetical protein
MSAFRAAKVGEHGRHVLLPEGRDGAGDDSAGSDFAGHGEKITWWQAAKIIGISDRHMRRWRERYEEFGYDGLLDRRREKPSPRRVALVERVLGLYRDRYHDVNVQHCVGLNLQLLYGSSC